MQSLVIRLSVVFVVELNSTSVVFTKRWCYYSIFFYILVLLHSVRLNINPSRSLPLETLEQSSYLKEQEISCLVLHQDSRPLRNHNASRFTLGGAHL